jgi:hypothetical protein
MVHAVRAAMASLKKTGTDFDSAQGMDPRSFFEVMGMFFVSAPASLSLKATISGLNDVIEFDAKSGSKSYDTV